MALCSLGAFFFFIPFHLLIIYLGSVGRPRPDRRTAAPHLISAFTPVEPQRGSFGMPASAAAVQCPVRGKKQVNQREALLHTVLII